MFHVVSVSVNIIALTAILLGPVIDAPCSVTFGIGLGIANVAWVFLVPRKRTNAGHTAAAAQGGHPEEGE